MHDDPRDVLIFGMASPQNSYLPGMIAALSRDILLVRKRGFHQDAKACIARLIPPLALSDPKIFQNIVRAFSRSIITIAKDSAHSGSRLPSPQLSLWGNRGVIIDVGSSMFYLTVLKLSSKVISLLLLFVREPRMASAVLSFKLPVIASQRRNNLSLNGTISSNI